MTELKEKQEKQPKDESSFSDVIEKQARDIEELKQQIASLLSPKPAEEPLKEGLDLDKPFKKHCAVGGHWLEQDGKCYNAKGDVIRKPRGV